LLWDNEKTGLHFKMMAAALKTSRPEYVQEYSVQKIRDSIIQEVKVCELSQ
jgi:hypothetical protein